MIPDIKRIKTIRKNMGLTQKELALKARISQSVIAKIESGDINPSYSIVKTIFEVFDGINREKNVRAKDIMSSHVVSLKKSDTLKHSINEMKKYGYSQLPIIDKGQSIGTVSEKIILDIISDRKNISDTLEESVTSFMSESLPRISEDESIETISALLKTNPATIVTKGGKIVGIITKADLFKIVKEA